MLPVLYDETALMYGYIPLHYGIGVLTDTLSCTVTEERNGAYELELTYPPHGQHAEEIMLRHIIKAKPNFNDDPQLFRIYKISKTLGGNLKINAQHISYDLSGVPIYDGYAANAADACALLSTQYFTIDTDKTVTADFEITEPSSHKSWLSGKAGSLLDVYGTGEYHYDNFNIHYLLHRGQNRGVEVRYAKNLLSLSQDIDSSNLATDIVAYWKSFEDGTVVKSQKMSTGLSLDAEQCICVDVSERYESAPTVSELNDVATSLAASQAYTAVKDSIKLDFLQLSTLSDRVDLCDEVTIIYEDFGINASAKCIKTTWNVLKDRYDSLELGTVRQNFATSYINQNKLQVRKLDHQLYVLAQKINQEVQAMTAECERLQREIDELRS